MSAVQSGAIDELLGVAVEGSALDQLEVEVARTLKDRVYAGLTSDDREERHLDEGDQSGGEECSVQRQAAVRAQRYVGLLLELSDDVDSVSADDGRVRPVERLLQGARHHRCRQIPHTSDPRVTRLGLLGARGQYLRVRTVRGRPEDYPLLLLVQGEAMLEQFGSLFAPVPAPVATVGAVPIQAGKHVEGVSNSHDALLGDVLGGRSSLPRTPRPRSDTISPVPFQLFADRPPRFQFPNSRRLVQFFG